MPSITQDRVVTRTDSNRKVIMALAAALAITVASLGVSAAPAGAAVPGAPKNLAVLAYADSIRVFFAPPTSDGGKEITGYRIQRTRLLGVLVTNIDVTSSAAYVDTTASPAFTYSYKVAAVNADGIGPYSDAIKAKRGTITDYTKYGNGAGAPSAFVSAQYQVLLGRAPTAGELSDAVDGLGASTLTAAAFINSLVEQPARVNERHPVIRLYFAYFDRGPDHGGLDFWVDARKNGGKSIDDESSSFAGSNEFKTTYGSLDTIGFVTLVYNNVLKRAPETSGLTFWVDQLNNQGVTRGRMMTQFSESNEFKNSSNGRALAADVYDAYKDAASPVGQLLDWAAHIQGGGSGGGYATYLLYPPPA